MFGLVREVNVGTAPLPPEEGKSEEEKGQERQKKKRRKKWRNRAEAVRLPLLLSSKNTEQKRAFSNLLT